MKNKASLITLLLFLVSYGASANSVKIEITKSSADDWFVTYTAASPVTRLSFVRTPNNSRIKRWSPISANYELSSENNKEFIRRVDRQRFTTASFKLTPTYIPLAKEYAPFSPFSDGGMLLHSARFFICPEICTRGEYVWEMTLNAPQNENIIVRGNVVKDTAKWIDAANGQKIYIGDATPIKDSHFVSIIDKKLPEKLHHSIQTELPALMAFFSDKLGKLGYRPTLFASYSKRKNGQYGNQGGTLPGQIFMHWYGNKSIQPFDTQATYWFFAHEVAHLYQGKASLIENPEEAWIHEGAAELFAGLASEPQYLNARSKKAKRKCASGLKKTDSYSKAVTARPLLHYSCGLVLMGAINTDLEKAGKMSIFTLWSMFNQAVSKGAPANAQTFIDTTKPHLSPKLGNYLAQFIASDYLDIQALSRIVKVKKKAEKIKNNTSPQP